MAGWGEAIISAIGTPFPVSTRIRRYEDYIDGLNKERKKNIRHRGWRPGSRNFFAAGFDRERVIW